MFAPRHLIAGTLAVLTAAALAASSAVAMPPMATPGPSAAPAAFSRQDKQVVPATAQSQPTAKRRLATGATARSFSSTDQAIAAGLAGFALIALASGFAITRSRNRRGPQRPALTH